MKNRKIFGTRDHVATQKGLARAQIKAISILHEYTHARTEEERKKEGEEEKYYNLPVTPLSPSKTLDTKLI